MSRRLHYLSEGYPRRLSVFSRRTNHFCQHGRIDLYESRKNKAAHVPLSKADDELQVCSSRDSLRYGGPHSFTGIDDALQYSEVGMMLGMQIWDHKVAVLTIT